MSDSYGRVPATTRQAVSSISMDRTIAGRFKVVRTVGSGGMATVVEALDLRLNRRVALKLVDSVRADAPMRSRFEREAIALAGLSHPNLVEVYDTGEEDGTLYIVMELVEGPDLATALAVDGPLTVARALDITDDVLAALTAVHGHGLVHRDVKPANVLIASGTTKLADFGIAKSLTAEANLTDTGQLLGTARYLAPERLSGHDASPASDVYSVGVMLFEMLAGAAPFNGDSPAVIAFAHHRAPVPDLAAHVSGIDPELSSIVRRALAKRPEDRFESAAAMRVALASVAQRQSVTPSPVQFEQQTALLTSRPARRFAPLKPAAIAIVGVAMLVAVLLWLADGDPIEQTTADVAVTVTTTATTAGSATTTKPRATSRSASPVVDIDALLDHLAERPGAYGVKQQDLLDKLTYVQQQSGAKRVEEAENLVAEASKWAAEGELDRDITSVAVDVLRDDSQG